MKKLEKALKNHKHLVFMDFEVTLYSSEMIAAAAISVVIDKHGNIKSKKPPFVVYVKPKNKIGSFVVNLTGITEDLIKEKGVSFLDAMKAFKKYVGHSFDKSTFITYNNHDMRILGQSIAYNLDFPKEICSQIQKNYFDFAAFFDYFIKDENGNSLSLIHACELFNLKLAEPAHDPANDTINLMNLYDAFIKHPEIVAGEYRKTFKHIRHVPEPIKKVIAKLEEQETVTSEDLDNFILEDLK